MSNLQILLTILIAAAVTVFLRFAPFVIFRDETKVPAFIRWLGNRLPMAVMAMLLVYCLKDVSFSSASSSIPALVGVAATVLLHLWKKQMILSIAGGTAVYMLLIRLL
ncbi:MAG: AzlD domain-containing protein [Clostridia bacterium]|nr:AzlD domain-containing protein [Clostridia bacterium]